MPTISPSPVSRVAVIDSWERIFDAADIRAAHSAAPPWWKRCALVNALFNWTRPVAEPRFGMEGFELFDWFYVGIAAVVLGVLMWVLMRRKSPDR